MLDVRISSIRTILSLANILAALRLRIQIVKNKWDEATE